MDNSQDRTDNSLNNPVNETLDDQLVEAEAPQEKSCRNTCLIILALNFILVFVLYAIYGKAAFTWLHEELTTQVRAGTPLSIAILLCLQIPFGTILFMPGLAYLNVLQALIMKNLFVSWAISFGGGYMVTMSVFFIIRTFFIEKVKKRFQHFEPYQMLLEETKDHPYRDGIVFGFVFIPLSVKNYLMAISELTFAQVCVANIPGNLILCFFCAMVGTQINDISDMFSKKSIWEKSFWEQVQFFVSMALMVLTAVFVLLIGFYYKKKYNEFVKRKKLLKHAAEVNEGKGDNYEDPRFA